MNAGDTVYYKDKSGAHFGRLIEAGYKWALIQMGEKKKRVLLADVKAWPPPKTEATSTVVKRGR